MDDSSLLAALQREVLRLQEQLTAMRFSVAELVCDVKKLTRTQSEPPDNDAAEVRMALQQGSPLRPRLQCPGRHRGVRHDVGEDRRRTGACHESL